MRPIHRLSTFIALALTILAACDFDPNRLRAKPDATMVTPDLAPPVDTASLDMSAATGGTTGNGGALGTGGSVATGGNPRTGGVLITGGLAITGGITTLGGLVATGGIKATGGVAQTGGVTITGGSVLATGGTLVAMGGTIAIGGVTGAAGGATVATGGTTTIPTGTTVSFLNGKASGAITGYAWIAMAPATAVTDPTCGTDKTGLTSTGCSTFVNWSTTDKVCFTGYIPALPANPVAADYTNNWGISLGLSATDPAGSGLGQTFSSVTFTLSGAPTSGLRATVHRKGEDYSISYCAPVIAGAAIPFTNFVTDCYNTTPTGTRITALDVPSIESITVQVPSGAAAIPITNLCITGLTFAK